MKMNKNALIPILISWMIFNTSIHLDAKIPGNEIKIKASTSQNDKKMLLVKKLKSPEKVDFKVVSSLLETHTRKYPVNIVNWATYDYAPKVEFRMAHNGKEIWLKYEVSEKYVRAVETKTNGGVHNDSCVEFFISFDGVNYYNFEFSCIGTRLVAYGPDRNNRKDIDPAVLESIRVQSTLGNQAFEEKEAPHSWELLVVIPVSCFIYSDIKTLDDSHATANFYKCGDLTTIPHYLSWNPVHTETPDYHRPEFFGKLSFE